VIGAADTATGTLSAAGIFRHGMRDPYLLVVPYSNSQPISSPPPGSTVPLSTATVEVASAAPPTADGRAMEYVSSLTSKSEAAPPPSILAWLTKSSPSLIEAVSASKKMAGSFEPAAIAFSVVHVTLV